MAEDVQPEVNERLSRAFFFKLITYFFAWEIFLHSLKLKQGHFYYLSSTLDCWKLFDLAVPSSALLRGGNRLSMLCHRRKTPPCSCLSVLPFTTQNKQCPSLVALPNATRSTTWAFRLCLDVNSTQLNYYSLQRATNPHPTLLHHHYSCTSTDLHVVSLHYLVCCLFLETHA